MMLVFFCALVYFTNLRQHPELRVFPEIQLSWEKSTFPVFLAWISFSKRDGKKAAYLCKAFFAEGVQMFVSEISYHISCEWVESGVIFVMCKARQLQCVSRAHTVISIAQRLERGKMLLDSIMACSKYFNVR